MTVNVKAVEQVGGHFYRLKDEQSGHKVYIAVSLTLEEMLSSPLYQGKKIKEISAEEFYRKVTES